MEYITTKEASAKWGISTARIVVLANEGRIPGAQCIGRTWLIPVGAARPEQLKGGRSRSTKKKTDNFSFPLYPFRPDWNSAKEETLSHQQRSLLTAQRSLLECRFEEAHAQLEPILHDPEDLSTEIGGLWSAGLCCVAMNRPEVFSRIFLRLQLLLSEDFPHRDDFAITLDFLNTYVETIGSAAGSDSRYRDLHVQCLPTMSILSGYAQLTMEAIEPGSAAASLLELNLRFLKNASAVVAVELLHIYLLGIYSLRQNTEEAEKHAKAAVQIAYETKIYFPLVSFYRYNIPIFSGILESYPEEFRNLCSELSAQYEKNYTAFIASVREHSVLSKLTDADYSYAFGVLIGTTNAELAEKLDVSPQTVKRKLDKICKKLGVKNKKELRQFLRSNM